MSFDDIYRDGNTVWNTVASFILFIVGNTVEANI